MATEHKSALAQLREKHAKKVKEYKCEHDVERIHHLAAGLVHLRDHTGAAALTAAMARELAGMSAKQADLDAEEKAELDKEVAAAQAADQKSAEAAASAAIPKAPASR